VPRQDSGKEGILVESATGFEENYEAIAIQKGGLYKVGPRLSEERNLTRELVTY
jgi:hypothetical protein